ncbi:MAG: hypothetical protein JWN14_190 [Chthonomonadales bacterium]|nr:hypothetical protein [Chthonomonadales bacterium]
MMFSLPARVAIIGGGFSGVMTAINLARLSRRPLHLTLINQHTPRGRGVAYGTRRPEHLLNVAARNMSAFPDRPDHFLEWMRTRSEYDVVPENELRERFVPRMVYGDYLCALVQQHLQSPPESILVETAFVEGEAVDIRKEANHAVVCLADGGCVEAEHVVLATGNEPPAGFPGSAELHDHPAWVGNPWQRWEDRLPASGGVVVLLGTGLSTIDAILTLRAQGWHGIIHAVSRNGWLPHPHFRGIEYPDFPPTGTGLEVLGLKDLVELMEEHCARLRDSGANPAIIVDKMRPHTQFVWQNFTLEERHEFTRRYAARWNVLRHRIAPEIYAQVTTSQLTGQLRLHAAIIEGVEALGKQVQVHLSDGQTLTGDLVINATGPQVHFSATRSVLLGNLLRSGLAAPDEMDMGLQVDTDHTVIAGDGQRSEILLALGPLLRGTLWETIAVPELRSQARRVVETLLGHRALRKAPPEVMMEYMI